MNESHTPLYTNNASSEFLSDLNKPNFTQQQLSNFSTQALETISTTTELQYKPPTHRYLQNCNRGQPNPERRRD